MADKLSPAMINGLRYYAGQHEDTFSVHPSTDRALLAHGLIDGVNLTDTGRAALAEIDGQPREEMPAADMSPDASEQGPAADGPIITPELRRAVVAAAHAESVSRDAHERVDALRAADHLDQPAPARNDTDRALLGRYADDRRVTGTAPHFRLGDGRAVWVVDNPIGRGQAWAAGTDGTHGTAEVINSTHYVCEAAITAAFDDADRAAAAQRVGAAVRATLADLDRPTAAPADPVAAIVDLIEKYGVARADAARAAITDALANEAPQRYRQASDLLDRIRRTLADALGSRRDRERYAVLMSAGGRPVVCPCGYGVFDSCPVHDNNDGDEPAAAVEQPSSWRAPLGPQIVAEVIRIANAGGRVLATTVPADLARLLVGVRWVAYCGPGRRELCLTAAGAAAVQMARREQS